MRKLLACTFTLSLALSFVGCSANPDAPSAPDIDPNNPPPAAPANPAPQPDGKGKTEQSAPSASLE